MVIRRCLPEDESVTEAEVESSLSWHYFLDNILIYIWISQHWTIILHCCLLGVLGFMALINGLVTGWESSGASEPLLRTWTGTSFYWSPSQEYTSLCLLADSFPDSGKNSWTMRQAHWDTWTTTRKDTAMFSGNTDKQTSPWSQFSRMAARLINQNCLHFCVLAEF